MSLHRHHKNRSTRALSTSVVIPFVLCIWLTALGLYKVLYTISTVPLVPLVALSIPHTQTTYLPGPLALNAGSINVLGTSTIDPRDIITFVNKERMKRNAPPLIENPTLVKAAQMRADVILKYQNFSHQDPYEHIQLDTVLPMVGYGFRYATENIGMGDYTGKAFVNGFMSSTMHRANLLDPALIETGTAIVTGPYKQYYVNIAVQLFAIPIETGASTDIHRISKEYENILSDIKKQLAKIRLISGTNPEKKRYLEDWEKLLIRQQEIVSILYYSVAKSQPITAEIVKLIEEYNTNWESLPSPDKAG